MTGKIRGKFRSKEGNEERERVCPVLHRVKQYQVIVSMNLKNCSIKRRYKT